MPVQKKTSWARLKVGVLAIAAMIIVAVVLVLITGDTPLFAGHATLYTYMNDATGLTDGAPATLNGITIGSVSSCNSASIFAFASLSAFSCASNEANSACCFGYCC